MAFVDFFVATPLDEEWRNLREVLGVQLNEFRGVDDRTWYLGRCSAGHLDYLIASASMGASTSGQSNAASFTSDLLRAWRPASVILVGIAGSFERSWHALGDVIVPEEVFGYEVGSQDERGGGRRKSSRRTLRPTGHRMNFVLMERVRALRNDKTRYEEWQARCFRSTEAKAVRRVAGATARKNMRPPELHFHRLASGNDVIRSSEFSRQLKQRIHPNLAGVEMEAKGVFTALHSSDSGAHFLMVRGVSDYADRWKQRLDKMSSVYRNYAAANAGRLVRAFLANSPQRPIGPRMIPQLEPDLSPLRAVQLKVPAQPGMHVFSLPSLIEIRQEIPATCIELHGFRGAKRVIPRACRFVLHRPDAEEHLTAGAGGVLDLPEQSEPGRLEAVLSFDGAVDLLKLVTQDAFGARNEWRKTL